LLNVGRQIVPFGAEDKSAESVLFEVALHVACVDTVRIFGIEILLDVFDCGCRLVPVLHEHPDRSRPATVFSLMYERDIDPRTSETRLQQKQGDPGRHFTAIKTITAVPSAIKIYVIC